MGGSKNLEINQTVVLSLCFLVAYDWLGAEAPALWFCSRERYHIHIGQFLFLVDLVGVDAVDG